MLTLRKDGKVLQTWPSCVIGLEFPELLEVVAKAGHFRFEFTPWDFMDSDDLAVIHTEASRRGWPKFQRIVFV